MFIVELCSSLWLRETTQEAGPGQDTWKGLGPYRTTCPAVPGSMMNNLVLATSRPWLCSAWGESPIPSWGGSVCATHTSSVHRNTSDPGHTHAYSRLPAEDATPRMGKEFMEGRRTHAHTPQSSRLEDVITSELSLLRKVSHESKRLGNWAGNTSVGSSCLCTSSS